MTDNVVKFAKIRCSPDPSFWAKFAELKVDKYKLEDKVQIPLWGSYSLNPEERTQRTLWLDYTSFNGNLDMTSHNAGIPCSGYMVNKNIFEIFKHTNPETFINVLGKELLESLKSGSALEEPWQLMTFIIHSHADLKKYCFHYWVAHPTPFNLPEMHYAKQSVFVKEEFTSSQFDSLVYEFTKLGAASRSFFTVIISKETKMLEIVSLAKGVEIANLGAEENKVDIYFAFYDPCSHTVPGWPLRNLLCLLFLHCQSIYSEESMKFISVRGHNLNNSVVYTIKTKNNESREVLTTALSEGKLVGWEINDHGKMGPNLVNLSKTMDPIIHLDRAISLNLRLIKWRLVPDLDLDYIRGLRCLLLGAGTLGCSVARILLGWGIHTITFVDNSVVSPSNIVRQNLYTHDDAVNQTPKAEAAKNALLKIHPKLKVEGLTLQIPMPGHVVGQSMLESTKEAVAKLEELYSRHDVVFLLLDSREARWLPTVLCAAYSKLAINAALGFDSYTVQRHGTRDAPSAVSPDHTVQNPGGKDLGCYFCNDVTQPGNSQVDRTLDLQCTVSRPGLSYIAAGLAVELMIALTQHPEKAEARALMEDRNDQNRSSSEVGIGLLGGVPHTVRGSLWSYDSRLTVTHRFSSCTACSEPIVAEYRKRGCDFIIDSCNQPNYLERLSGLEEMLKGSELDELFCALDTSDEDEKGTPENLGS